MESNIKKYINESIETKKKIVENSELVSRINKAISFIIDAYRTEKKVLLAGNGGSAADAQHIATELVSKFLKESVNAFQRNVIKHKNSTFSFTGPRRYYAEQP